MNSYKEAVSFYKKGKAMSIDEGLQNEINKVLKHEIAQRHSYFQLKYFLIGKEPTLQSKMWQCLRELKTRKDSLEAIELEIQETKDKIELLDISIEKMKLDSIKQSEDLDRRECEIKIRQLERQKKAAESNLSEIADRRKWIEEECIFFFETFKNINKIEELKNFDDFEAQKQYWGEKLTQKLNLKMLTSNQLDSELIETIVALPDDIAIKKQTLNTLNLRHINMVNQLKQTMQMIEEKEKKEN